MSNLLCRTAAVAIGTVGLLPVLAGAALADAPTRTAWWNAASANGISLPQPTTGADSLHVGQSPEGPTAYAGVAYDLTGQAIAGATLQLKIVSGSAVGTVKVSACPTKNTTWKAGGNQPISAAPGYDCAGGAPGSLAADGASVTFLLDARQLLVGSYSLAIVPTEGAAPFQVDFAKPDAASLSPELAAAPVTEPGPAAAPPPYVPPASSGVAPLSPATVAQPPAFGAVQAPALAVPVAPAPRAAPAPQAPAAAAPSRRPVEPVSNRDRYAAGTALALLAGALVWALQQPASTPRLIGGMARKAGPQALTVIDVQPRGIGRFSTLRTAPARPLL